MTKKAVVWYKSRLLWVNMIVTALGALEVNTNLLQSVLSVDSYLLLAAVLPTVNAALRKFMAEEQLHLEKRKTQREGA